MRPAARRAASTLREAVATAAPAGAPVERPGFAFKSARPNPFTGATALEFTLPSAARVDLRVHDARGREVACPAAGAYAAGRHVVSFRARDAQGRALAPGAYFAHLQATTADGVTFDRTVRVTSLR